MSNSFPIRQQINQTTEISGATGTTITRTDNTVYQAATDGFVTTYGNCTVYSDTNASPTTIVMQGSTGAGAPGMVVPILKNQYWKSVSASSVWWTPMGT